MSEPHATVARRRETHAVGSLDAFGWSFDEAQADSGRGHAEAAASGAGNTVDHAGIRPGIARAAPAFAPEAEWMARAVVEAAGFEPVGPARRAQMHFEILGRRDGHDVELRVALDGSLRTLMPSRHAQQQGEAS